MIARREMSLCRLVKKATLELLPLPLQINVSHCNADICKVSQGLGCCVRNPDP